MGNMRRIETGLTGCLPPACHDRKIPHERASCASCPSQPSFPLPLPFFPISNPPKTPLSTRPLTLSPLVISSVPFLIHRYRFSSLLPIQWLLQLASSPQDILLPSARPRKFLGLQPQLRPTVPHRLALSPNFIPNLSHARLHRVRVGATRIMDMRPQPSCVPVSSLIFSPVPTSPLPLRPLQLHQRPG